MQANAERTNGKANDVNERNTFFIYDTVNADQELRKNVRLCSLNGRKMFEDVRRFLPLGLIWFQKSARLRVCVWCAPGGEAGLCLW
jgi:hypothetical protein